MFLADRPDNPKTGIPPFATMDGSEKHRAGPLELARLFNLLYEFDFSVAFNDLEKFKPPKELHSYPVSFFEMEHNLGLIGNLLLAILGVPHLLTSFLASAQTATPTQN